MKKFTFTLLLIIFTSVFMAQTPPHPGDGSGGGPGAGDPPVGAPLGGSVAILLVLGLGYTSKKIYNRFKLIAETQEIINNSRKRK